MTGKVSMRRGDEYVASLRDGRAVFLDGERVADVTTHPAFAEPMRRIAALRNTLSHDFKVDFERFFPDWDSTSPPPLLPRSRARDHQRPCRGVATRPSERAARRLMDFLNGRYLPRVSEASEQRQLRAS